MTLPKDMKIDPNKIALGCKPVPDKPGILVCEPKIEHEGTLIPLSRDTPIEIERVEPKKWRLVTGGSDLTAEKIKALKEALKRVELEIE